MFPAENNFIGITFLEHFPDPNTPEENPLTYDITFRYALYILTAPYEAGKPGAAFVHGDFVSPTGVTVKDFTGEPCFIFIKEGTDIPYTVYAIKEFPTDIPTTDTLTIHITRDNSSKFTFFVNNNVLFSGKDTSPPSTSLDAEGYYSGLCSFGGGSWIDNINVSDTITVTEEKKASEPGIIPIVIGLGILIIIRKKRKS